MLLENATVRRYEHLQGERNTLKQLFSAILKRVKTWIDSVLICIDRFEEISIHRPLTFLLLVS